ncbi:hypothetical protein [Streptomyces sp. NBC_01363]|uniref:hypothetical protein n=1 Tax=Streptomyces sp. NBC_01363 TaxID=2903840 RepID=UPI002257A0AB|nr:hypothetical protein [Streptomyces sp. NBC_01363]MCX4730839.1 hypothetical protein [Streptomyces sp. NBC_01363]
MVGSVVDADALGLVRHLSRVDRAVLRFSGGDVLVDGLALELPLYGLLDMGR